ncbi:MAG: prolipoprotein diacylglyceryl transferase [Brachymonas sp.]|nr:prolipoprotein diacylglyceryl transferase [Brachymonas sp.]
MKTTGTMLRQSTLGKWAYGSLFTVLLPAVLVLWAWGLETALGLALWPLPLPAWAGGGLALLGLGLMIAAMRDLWVLGKGLPMNAFPPERLVHQSSYAWLRHPIYVGFVLLVAGVSVLAGSRAGFWIVAPMMALACAALVLGHEAPAMRRRFGAQVQRPVWLGLPLADAASAGRRPGLARRLAATAVALGPWACVYALWAQLPAPINAHALRMPWELVLHAHLQGAVSQAAWVTYAMHLAVYVYSATYVLAVAAPVFLPSAQALRRYVISAWLATSIGFACMLLWPGSAALLPMPQTGVAGWLAQMNRALDAAWLACPSFHMVWTTLAVLCLRMRFARCRWLWWALLATTGLSCVLTGSHAVVDVPAGVLLAWLCWQHLAVWAWLVRLCERLANAWDAVHIGPVRIINHAIWSALAAGVGLLLVAWLVGPGLLPWIAAVFGVAILAAGAWGYGLEGGGALSRPFGYYGFLLGAAASLLGVAACDWHAGAALMAAFACAAPLAQAIGRLRCLMQGCCHGRPVFSALGLCVRHPRSRVAALSHLRGVPIHPTQLYSIVGNIIIFAVLWRMWQTHVPGTCIAGSYLMLSSLARFVEEQYRGEVQTRTLAGLAVYQWLAVGVWLAGMVVSVLPAEPVYKAAQLSAAGVALAVAGGAVAAFLMSVDFPRSRARFSRLTVDETAS